MIYPSYVKQGDCIGITAPSDGNSKETDYIRLDHGKKQLAEHGYRLLETSNVRSSENGRSSNARKRAKELEELLENPEITWIIAAKGGDFLMEMLSEFDFSSIRKYPKWVQGYSDNTGLTFTITTNYDVATIYGCNFNDFGMEYWHPCIHKNLELVTGLTKLQYSFDYFEDGFYDRITGLEGYHEDQPVDWKIAGDEDFVEISGRLLGGCLDVLLNLVGTRFDQTIQYVNRYKEDGILWYLESFALEGEALIRGLWQLKEAGWFLHATGFLFGRPAFYNKNSWIPYDEGILQILGELKVPILFDLDIGHKAPQMTMINGAFAKVTSRDGRGTMELEFME